MTGGKGQQPIKCLVCDGVNLNLFKDRLKCSDCGNEQTWQIIRPDCYQTGKDDVNCMVCTSQKECKKQPTPGPGQLKCPDDCTWFREGKCYCYHSCLEMAIKCEGGNEIFYAPSDIKREAITVKELQALRQQVKDKDEDIDELKKQLEDAWEHTAKADDKIIADTSRAISQGIIERIEKARRLNPYEQGTRSENAYNLAIEKVLEVMKEDE